MKDATSWQRQNLNYEQQYSSEFSDENFEDFEEIENLSEEEFSKQRKRAERRKKTACKKQRIYKNYVAATKNLKKRKERDKNCRVYLFTKKQVNLEKQVRKMEA